MTEFHDPPAHLLDAKFGTTTGRPRSSLRMRIDEIPVGKMILLDPAEVGSVVKVRNTANEASKHNFVKTKRFRVLKTEDGKIAVIRMPFGDTEFLK